jgi:hypothetical protein
MPQPLLSGEQEYVKDEPSVTDELMHLSDRVAALESRLVHIKREAVITLLQMLSDSMKHVASGKMDIPEVSASTPSAENGKWEILKQKYAGTHTGRAIEALMIHKRLSTAQLAANIGTSKQNAYNNLVPKMIKLGILTRQGTDLVLRES